MEDEVVEDEEFVARLIGAVMSNVEVTGDTTIKLHATDAKAAVADHLERFRLQSTARLQAAGEAMAAALEDARPFLAIIRLRAKREGDAEQEAEAGEALEGVAAALALHRAAQGGWVMADKPKGSGGFLLLWAYLMFISIMLAPVLAAFVKQELERAFPTKDTPDDAG